MLVVRTAAVEETQDVAARIAALCQRGDLLILSGDLGAGKTAFTQGFGRALGIEEPITSPTFTLANEYQGDITLHHLDVYRIEELEEVRDLALPELLDGPAVTVIEWGDVIAPALPSDFLEVRFSFGSGDDDREMAMRCIGSRWSARSTALCEALAELGAETC